jgi:hypothetical protein
MSLRGSLSQTVRSMLRQHGKHNDYHSVPFRIVESELRSICHILNKMIKLVDDKALDSLT